MKSQISTALANVLNSIAARLKPIEEDLADSAASQEAMAEGMSALNGKLDDVLEQLSSLATSYDKLTELYVRLESRTDQTQAMVGNYVEGTKERIQKADRALERAQILESSVREKMKACP